MVRRVSVIPCLMCTRLISDCTQDVGCQGLKEREVDISFVDRHFSLRRRNGLYSHHKLSLFSDEFELVYSNQTPRARFHSLGGQI